MDTRSGLSLLNLTFFNFGAPKDVVFTISQIFNMFNQSEPFVDGVVCPQPLPHYGPAEPHRLLVFGSTGTFFFRIDAPYGIFSFQSWFLFVGVFLGDSLREKFEIHPKYRIPIWGATFNLSGEVSRLFKYPSGKYYHHMDEVWILET